MVNFTSSKILASYFHLFNQILTDADCFFKQIASNFNNTNMIGDNVDIKALNERIEKESAFIDLLTQEMNKVIIGQKKMVERLFFHFGIIPVQQISIFELKIWAKKHIKI